MISTGAAFGVLLRDKGAGNRVRVGSGMLFWLICSIAASIMGIMGTICVWGSRFPFFATAMKKARLDGIGLMTSQSRRESVVTQRIRDREEEDRRISLRLARIKEAKKERIEKDTSLSSLSGLDPMWQALYTTPEELRAKIKTESGQHEKQHEKQPIEMGLRTGRDVKKKGSIEAETILSGRSDLLKFNDSDIGVQTLSTTPVGSSTAENIESYSAYARTGHEIDSRFPFSKFHSPARQKVFRSANKVSKSTTPFISSHEPSNELQSEEEPSPESLSSYNSLFTHATPSKTRSITGRTKASRKCHPLSSDLDLAPSLNNGTTSVSALSPLENLARDLNTSELRSLGIQDRHNYIISRRSINEERGRRVRQSLERIPLAKNFGFAVSGDGVEVGSIRPKVIEEHESKSMSKIKAGRPIVQEIVRGIESRSLSLTGEWEGILRPVKSSASANSKASSDENSRESTVKKLVRESFDTNHDIKGRR